MSYRKADATVKNDAKVFKDSCFHQPINSDYLIYYFGVSSICSCRWNWAYDTCKHIFK
jgi:hypothetical protein